MKIAIVGVTSLALLLILAAYSSLASAGDATKATIRDTTWSVEQIDGRTPIRPATLTFGPEYRLSGSTGCNPYSGVYEMEGKEVAIRYVAVASGPCDGAAAQQASLMQVLNDHPRFVVEPNGKISILGKTRGVAVLSPAANISLSSR